MITLKKIFLTIITSLSTTTVFALACPSISEIKNSELYVKDWLPLYIDNEELISVTDMQHFQTAVQAFDYAEWNTHFAEYAHCFYKGDDAITTRIILAHDAYHPDSSTNWQWIHPKHAAKCMGLDAAHCKFIE